MAHWDESNDSKGFVMDESIRTKEPSTRQSLTKGSNGDDASPSEGTTSKTREPVEPMKIMIKRHSSHNSSSTSFQSESSNDLKRERTRRVSRGSSTKSELSKPKAPRTSLEKCLEGGLHDNGKRRSQPNDTKSLPSGTLGDHLDGNVSLSLESAFMLDEKSVKTAPPASAAASVGGVRSKRESILKEGEESFQVISAPGRSYSFGLTAVSSKKPRDKAGNTTTTTAAAFGRSYNDVGTRLDDAEELDESSNRHIVRSGHDAYENSKLRLSRGKAAAKNAERSSRKSEILAALDQTTTSLSDEEWVGAPLRVVPERSKSTTASGGVGGGAIRPMIRRAPPTKSRSEMGTKLLVSTNPSLVVSKAKVDAAADRSTGRSENGRREIFHQSFN